MHDMILRVSNLSLELCTPGGPVQALHGLTFGLRRSEILGVIGESGSGKTLTALAIMGLLRPPRAAITSGNVEFSGRIITLHEATMRALRGREIAMIFQDPLTALNPYLRVSTQLTEALVLRHGLPKKRALEWAVEMCGEVGIPQPDKRIFCYPHELSGGMRQRVLIAMALLLHPRVLIADEPTSAIDAVLQGQITAVFERFRRKHEMSILLITHDLDVLARCCDRVIVMYGGRIVEENSVDEVLERPRHPYTRALLQAALSGSSVRRSRHSCPSGPESSASSNPTLHCPFEPRYELALSACRERARLLEPARQGGCIACHNPVSERSASPISPILEIEDVHKSFTIAPRSIWAGRRQEVTALAGISLALNPGETLGIVGESGSGKSTLAKIAAGLLKPDAGNVRFFGTDLAGIRGAARHSLRKELQMVFQDPCSSLDPRMTVSQTIAEPLEIAVGRGLLALTRHRLRREVHRLLEMVGLSSGFAMRTPSELSGGQQQRVGIARALALKPKLLVCDEPTSALDVSVQAEILNLLLDMQAELRLSYIFISHNLAVVRHVSDRVGVMYRGKLVELDETERIFSEPRHPYTASLISSVVGSPLGRLRLHELGV